MVASKTVVNHGDGYCVQRLGNRVSQPSCQHCELFRRVRAEPKGAEKNYKLISYVASDTSFCRPARYDRRNLRAPLFLAVVPDNLYLGSNDHLDSWIYEDIPASGAIFHSTSEHTNEMVIMRPRKVGRQVCFDALRGWAACCNANYGHACSSRIASGIIKKAFRLVDCY